METAALLIECVSALSLADSERDVQQIVRGAARALVHADGATFVLRDEGHCYYADEDAIAPLWKGLRFPMESCISGWSMLHRAAVAIPDIYLDARIPHDAYRPTFVKSLVMVPIRRAEPIGAIGTYWAAEHTATDEEVSLLQALADSTSIALERVAALRALERAQSVANEAVLDDLTGLANRRGFYMLAQNALDRVRRSGLNATLLFIDLDGLKTTNDRLGHAAGDELLVQLARTLRATFRDEDVLARLGGDEFVVLCTGRGAADPGARLRASLSAGRSEDGSGVRASIGTATYSPGDTLEGLVASADAAMYLDKLKRAAAPTVSSSLQAS